jgi:hypothetical protein
MDYATNFKKAAKILMAEKDLDTIGDLAEYVEIPKGSLYKIMDGSNKPTVEQCITLSKKGGFSLNWMLMGRGDMYMKTEATLSKILNAITGK